MHLDIVTPSLRMPPRKSKRVQDAAEMQVDGKEMEIDVESEAVPPSKRKRRDELEEREENGHPPPPPPIDEAPPPPPVDDTSMPPPPIADEEDPPAPPSPPPVDIEALIPPPPPPEPTNDRRREVEQDQDKADGEIGGADYWEKIAREDKQAKMGVQGGRDLYLDTVSEANGSKMRKAGSKPSPEYNADQSIIAGL